MYKGKSTCQQLKKIRREIAEANHIPWEDSECHYEGDCAGTCPKCDAEVRFLENALRKGQQLGKAVALSGAALAFSACGNQTPGEMPFDDTVDSADVVMQNDSVDTETVKLPPAYKEEVFDYTLDVGLVLDSPEEEEEELMEIEELPEEEEKDFQK